MIDLGEALSGINAGEIQNAADSILGNAAGELAKLPDGKLKQYLSAVLDDAKQGLPVDMNFAEKAKRLAEDMHYPPANRPSPVKKPKFR